MIQRLLSVIALMLLHLTLANVHASVEGWPKEVQDVLYPASIDQSQQPALLYVAKGNGKRPLLVGLHTWSGDYRQAGGQAVFARWCIDQDWHFIHPHFRGPNMTPDACGSEKVVQDIIDAVEYMKRHHHIDTDRIYLVGASGGGYASLLMAGRAPELWAGVSAWVPITDIKAWWEQCSNSRYKKYANHIEQVIGGKPVQSNVLTEKCVKRSANTYLHYAANVNIDINAGVYDGRKGSVPFTHSLHAFNALVPSHERISDAAINEFYENQSLPAGLVKAKVDPLYGEKQPIFRKTHNHTRVTIFRGGHEIIHSPALNWLAAQRKSMPTQWQVEEVGKVRMNRNDSESGK